MKTVDIIAAARSGIASVSIESEKNTSVLSELSPIDLAGQVLRNVFEGSGVSPEEVDSFCLASAITQKFSPGLYYALPNRILSSAFPGANLRAVCRLTEKACSSGGMALRSTMTDILTRQSRVALACGIDLMCGQSNALIMQGLTDPETGDIMAAQADKTTNRLIQEIQNGGDFFGLVPQYQYTKESFQLTHDHVGDHTIVPIYGNDGTLLLDHDEGVDEYAKKIGYIERILANLGENPDKAEKMIRRSNYPDCSLTSTLTSAKYGSAAAAILLADPEWAEDLGLPRVARIVAFAEHSEENPEDFILAPYGAAKKVLALAELSAEDIDRWENNPAFALAPLWLMYNFGIPRSKINSWGDAIAHGHPIGATLLILLWKLIQILQKNKERTGLLAVCNAIGEATAFVIEIY